MVAGHLQIKNDRFYCVLTYVSESGKRHQVWKATGLTVKGNKTKAEEMLINFRQTFIVPKEVSSGDVEFSSDMLFTDFMRSWLEIVRTTVVETTFGGYQSMIMRKMIPYFEPKCLSLSSVQAKDLQNFYLHEGKTLSGTTIKHEHALLHKLLKYAVQMDLIPSNPAEKVNPPRAAKFEGKALTEEELERLIASTWNHKLGLLIYVTALFGLRRSEVLGLRWKAVDFDNNTVTINHTVTEAKIDGAKQIISSNRTKTKSSYRTYPLSDTLKDKLLKWKEVQEENRKACGNCYNKSDIDYIFTDEMGNRFKPRYVEDAFPKLVKKAGLEHIRFHDLRHTCASLMHKMGLSPKEVQDYLGHSTISITLNIYTHLDWSNKKNAAKAMDSVIKTPEGLNSNKFTNSYK